MIRISQCLVLCLCLLAIVTLGGCCRCGSVTARPTSDTMVKIGLLEQVEDQQARIEDLEWEMARLREQHQLELDAIEAEIEELYRQHQERPVEALEWTTAELR